MITGVTDVETASRVECEAEQRTPVDDAGHLNGTVEFDPVDLASFAATPHAAAHRVPAHALNVIESGREDATIERGG